MPKRLPERLAEQWMLGALVAVALSLIDALLALERSSGHTAAEGAVAALHLMALSMPVGILLGGLSWLLLSIARQTPWLHGVRRRLSDRFRFFEPAPDAVSATLAAALGFLVMALFGRTAYELLVTRTHRVDLAAWVMGAMTAAAALLGLATAAVARLLLRPVVRRLLPFASAALFSAAALVSLGVGAWAFLSARPELIRAYGWARLLFAPLAVSLWCGLWLGLRTLFRHGSTAGRHRGTLAAGAVLLALFAFVCSALTYGASNRVRALVEQHTVLGRPLLRRYAPWTDMDGDGHSWAFGGRDCDDLDPAVHPGAADPEGDGVDSDCFSGDGSPDVSAHGDGGYGRLPAGLPEKPNFVLVTIDALRPDRLHIGGNPRPTSPHIDRFAQEAVFFDTVVAQSSRSLRSIPAMLSGRYPSEIAYGPEFLFPAVLPENILLPEVLADQGYRTAVTMGTDYFRRVGQFFQGFQEVNQLPLYKPPRARPVDEGLAQLRKLAGSDSPFFLWLHLFNVHEPYLVPPHPSRFGRRRIDHYDTEIVLADRAFQRVLDAIDELHLADQTVVVLASDHGEAFGEHGIMGHSTTLYEEELRATLIIRVPGLPPRRVSEPVALFDLFPTLLNLVGTAPPVPVPSRSLLPLMWGEGADPARLIFSELMPDGLFPFDIKSVRQGSDKLLWWVQDGTFQLFSLREDPGEEDDRSDRDRGRALELLGLLQAWVAQTNRPENRTDAYIEAHRLARPPARMTHPLDVRVPGMFTILGFDFPRRTFRPGERMPLTFYYRADARTQADVFFRVSIEGPPGYRVPPHFHAHHYPLRARYPTPRWRPGEILRDSVPMVVPPEIQTPVELWVTLMLQLRGGGLMAFEANGRPVRALRLAPFRVESPRRMPPGPAARPASAVDGPDRTGR